MCAARPRTACVGLVLEWPVKPEPRATGLLDLALLGLGEPIAPTRIGVLAHIDTDVRKSPRKSMPITER
jgi:hypothetical protein